MMLNFTIAVFFTGLALPVAAFFITRNWVFRMVLFLVAAVLLYWSSTLLSGV